MSTNVIIHLNGPYGNPVSKLATYKVGRVTNTIDWKPGDMLNENEVRSLCANGVYTIHIDPPVGSTEKRRHGR